MNKEIKLLAKKIQKEIQKEGWTINVHTMVLALLSKISAKSGEDSQ